MSTNFSNSNTSNQTNTEIKIDTLSEPQNARDFLTLEQFNSVEYDSDHLWFCTIDGAPSPFDKWFPAKSITEPTKGLSVSAQSFGLEEINTLNMYNALSLRTELLDDAEATLELWLRKWQKDCSVENYYGFRYLDEILHAIYITKYTWQKEKIYTHKYYVIPSGDITINHNDDPNLKVINVNFAVFGSDELTFKNA